MHRLTVAFLAAFDAVIAATVGLAVVLATLTLLWIFGLGGMADWGTLWPAAVAVWQLGNLVPLHIHLPVEYLAASGIGEDQASFLLSLAPLAFAAFTAIFAARSGARASGADAWITGVLVGTLVFAGLTAGAAVTARTPIAAVHLWQAVLFPVLLFAVPATVGAVVTEWREAGAGVVARLRDRLESAERGWGETAGLIARGAAVVLVGLVGAGALLVVVAVVMRGGDVVALFQASGVDLVGVVVFALGQLAYLPTLVVWGIAFVAGPGFQVGSATTVAPAGTQIGVVPGIPVLGLLPESSSMWLLLLALLPVALGAFAGWIARSRLAGVGGGDAAPPHASADDPGRRGALVGLLLPAADGGAEPDAVDAPPPGDSVGARVVIAVGIALLAAGGAALLSWVASGSLGPGRLAEVGPEPGPVAFAVGLEVLIGAAILLLSPRPGAAPRAPLDAPETVGAASDPFRIPDPEPVAVAVAGPAGYAPVAPAPDDAASPEPDAVTAPIELPEQPER